MRIGITWLAPVLAAALPRAAAACAVCSGGTTDNRLEFIATTAFLTFLPLGLMGGIFWYLRRRYLALANPPPSGAAQQVPAVAPRSSPVAG